MSSAALALLERVPLSEKTGRAEYTEPPTLGRVLYELGKEPFSEESVDRYKRHRAEEANKWLWLRRCTVYVYFSTLVGILAGSVFSILCGWSLAGPLLRLRPEALPLEADAIFFLVSLGVLSVSAELNVLLRKTGIVADTRRGMIAKGRAVWKVVSEEEYKGGIPPEVYVSMCEIRENLPEIKFFVHVLTHNEIILDPFVEARYGKERALTDVWDEAYPS